MFLLPALHFLSSFLVVALAEQFLYTDISTFRWNVTATSLTVGGLTVGSLNTTVSAANAQVNFTVADPATPDVTGNCFIDLAQTPKGPDLQPCIPSTYQFVYKNAGNIPNSLIWFADLNLTHT